jgi:regulator of replication initiation timing
VAEAQREVENVQQAMSDLQPEMQRLQHENDEIRHELDNEGSSRSTAEEKIDRMKQVIRNLFEGGK